MKGEQAQSSPLHVHHEPPVLRLPPVHASSTAIWLGTFHRHDVHDFPLLFLIKITFFFSLVRAQIKSDLLRDHFLFLGVLYTAAVAFLSLVFLVAGGQDFPDGRLE